APGPAGGRDDHDGRGLAADDRAVRLAVPARRARGRGAPGAARPGRRAGDRAVRSARRARGRRGARGRAAQAAGLSPDRAKLPRPVAAEPLVSVLVPAYNEARTIEGVV